MIVPGFSPPSSRAGALTTSICQRIRGTDLTDWERISDPKGKRAILNPKNSTQMTQIDMIFADFNSLSFRNKLIIALKYFENAKKQKKALICGGQLNLRHLRAIFGPQNLLEQAKVASSHPFHPFPKSVRTKGRSYKMVAICLGEAVE